ncbi:MAG: hypothetical protein N2746_03320 [Deltaproteobacteria bacterium]|nr:hypothetical protein [Deltaproteobacteria bacterium]
MLDAFIIERLKKEKRRENRREVQIPLYIEEPSGDEISNIKRRGRIENNKYYERIDIDPEYPK